MKLFNQVLQLFGGWFPVGLRRKHILELYSPELRCKPLFLKNIHFPITALGYSTDSGFSYRKFSGLDQGASRGLVVSWGLVVSALNKQSFQNKIIILTRNYSTSSPAVVPIFVYENADLEKERIINDNKGKAGVYR